MSFRLTRIVALANSLSSVKEGSHKGCPTKRFLFDRVEGYKGRFEFKHVYGSLLPPFSVRWLSMRLVRDGSVAQ